MIFFGKTTRLKFKLGVVFTKSMGRVSQTDYIPHYYLILRVGHQRYYIGYNRLKRIIRDKVYELDGKKIKYEKS
jgi:hypothetical protein